MTQHNDHCKCGNLIAWHRDGADLVTNDMCLSCEARAREERLKNSEYTVEMLIEKLKTLDPKKKIWVLDQEYGPWVVREVTEDVVDGQDVILIDG